VFFSVQIAAQEPVQPTAVHRQFEVVAVKLSSPDQHGSRWNGRSDRITVSNYTLRHLIRVAYNLKSDLQILGGPSWMDKSHFDINAKIDDADAAAIYNLRDSDRDQQIHLMLQSFLIERFQLKLKQDQRRLPVYLLEVAKSGAKITPLPDPKDSAEAGKRSHGTSTNNGHLLAQAISMDKFADYLTEWTESGDRVVVNHTGLNGDFDFTLNWTQDRGGGIPADAPLPGLFSAIQQQLGLILKSDKSAMPIVVIEAASLPQLD
jgi:uncharacterized protein (TIGR03435 family)